MSVDCVLIGLFEEQNNILIIVIPFYFCFHFCRNLFIHHNCTSSSIFRAIIGSFTFDICTVFIVLSIEKNWLFDLYNEQIHFKQLIHFLCFEASHDAFPTYFQCVQEAIQTANVHFSILMKLTISIYLHSALNNEKNFVKTLHYCSIMHVERN